MIQHSVESSNLISNVRDTADGFILGSIYKGGNININNASACIYALMASTVVIFYTFCLYMNNFHHYNNIAYNNNIDQ